MDICLIDEECNEFYMMEATASSEIQLVVVDNHECNEEEIPRMILFDDGLYCECAEENILLITIRALLSVSWLFLAFK